MISAPLRVSAPKAAVGCSFLLGGASSSSVESKPKPKPNKIRIRCAATATATATAAAAVVGSGGASTATLYDVLGLRAGATAREIKAAYRRLARERHPDVAPGAAAEFVRLHHAYATLSDPDTRARYDRGAVPAVAMAVTQRPTWSGGVYGRPRRTWETDQCW